jgi:hypothetical protein
MRCISTGRASASYRDLLADKSVGEVLGRLQQLVSALTD